jgi:hypothetical protein
MRAKAKPLESGYTGEVDTVDRIEWGKIIDQFSDANIYQTWSYDAIRCGEGNISHLVLRAGDKIVAAAQARIVRIPIIGRGAAYVRWAPLWRSRDETEDPAVFRNTVRALRNEYVCRRGLILRIFPILFDDSLKLYVDLICKEGYVRAPERETSRTLMLDISPPTEELRKNMDQKWRNCLNRAERNELNIIDGTDDNLFSDFIGLYRDLLRRKKFPEPNDINEFRMIQRDLPNEHKMNVILCRSSGTSSVGGIFAGIGETGIYLFGATNAQGMENKGSYLIQWKAIQWMKKIGCRYYNLNGINPATNPGTYHFKAGLSGQKGKDVNYLGSFDCYPGGLSAMLARTGRFAFPFMKKKMSIIGLRTRSKTKKA